MSHIIWSTISLIKNEFFKELLDPHMLNDGSLDSNNLIISINKKKREDRIDTYAKLIALVKACKSDEYHSIIEFKQHYPAFNKKYRDLMILSRIFKKRHLIESASRHIGKDIKDCKNLNFTTAECVVNKYNNADPKDVYYYHQMDYEVDEKSERIYLILTNDQEEAVAMLTLSEHQKLESKGLNFHRYEDRGGTKFFPYKEMEKYKKMEIRSQMNKVFTNGS